jgi:hypothetical protein
LSIQLIANYKISIGWRLEAVVDIRVGIKSILLGVLTETGTPYHDRRPCKPRYISDGGALPDPWDFLSAGDILTT